MSRDEKMSPEKIGNYSGAAKLLTVPEFRSPRSNPAHWFHTHEEEYAEFHVVEFPAIVSKHQIDRGELL